MRSSLAVARTLVDVVEVVVVVDVVVAVVDDDDNSAGMIGGGGGAVGRRRFFVALVLASVSALSASTIASERAPLTLTKRAATSANEPDAMIGVMGNRVSGDGARLSRLSARARANASPCVEMQ